MAELIGQVLHDRYCIQSLLGRKTGRRTFLASDVQTQLPVVIKLLLFGPDFTWEDLKLFEREAETLKYLNYPEIPRYLDSFEIETELGKGFVLVQTYLEARSLQEWIQSGRSFNEVELKIIAKQLLGILDYLHSRQPPIIHRDIKPSNILLGDRSGNNPGQVYLVDFGSVQTTGNGGTVTVVGTYGYMPPEQFGGRSLPASDLYGLGATLIYLSTGQHPGDLPQKDLRVEFESATNLSQPFIRWIQWLTQPSLSSRPASAKEALRYIQQTPNQAEIPSSNLRLSQISRCPNSKIQLQVTPKNLELKVPANQAYVLKLFLLRSLNIPPAIKRVAILGFVSTSLVLLILGLWGVVFLLISFLLSLLPFALVILLSYRILRAFFPEKEGFYNITFSSENNSIHVSLNLSKLTDSPVFSKVKLRSISVGHDNMPRYQLNFDFHGSGNNNFYIIGNRTEIQWLCDELNEWSGIEISYRPPSNS
ncbi:MAG: serine/threonine protein kinase [Leptolyngbyaceae cyanobacterium CSU_1_4]|nr:serine/threonine protein kinase [Leptolyngbyaceae cyanobacterium CSU_1_4]